MAATCWPQSRSRGHELSLPAAKDADKARAAGSAAPLLGLPLRVKDSYLTKGLPTSPGLDGLDHFAPWEDADMASVLSLGGRCIKTATPI
ncbi:amidase family protein [Bradyrhizobium sp. Ai1a-2]|uniref:amidase family protein n=1 Tax=Bradyrhizobium sp. Ai1a-2 TaxID=196490 RepID=UPI0004810139